MKKVQLSILGTIEPFLTHYIIITSISFDFALSDHPSFPEMNNLTNLRRLLRKSYMYFKKNLGQFFFGRIQWNSKFIFSFLLRLFVSISVSVS